MTLIAIRNKLDLKVDNDDKMVHIDKELLTIPIDKYRTYIGISI